MSKSTATPTTTEDNLTAQQRANKAQNERRKTMARLPSAYLSDEENELVTRLGKVMGTKRSAIFAGLALLEKKLMREGKVAKA